MYVDASQGFYLILDVDPETFPEFDPASSVNASNGGVLITTLQMDRAVEVHYGFASFSPPMFGMESWTDVHDVRLDAARPFRVRQWDGSQPGEDQGVIGPHAGEWFVRVYRRDEDCSRRLGLEVQEQHFVQIWQTPGPAES